MIKKLFKTSTQKPTTAFFLSPIRFYINPKLEEQRQQNKILKIINKNQEPSQDRIKTIILKNKLLREPLI